EFVRSMILDLLTLILIWAAVGLIVWYLLLKLIPKNFLAWFGGAIILTLIVLAFSDPNDQTIGAIWNIISLPLSPLGFSLALILFSFKAFNFKEGFRVVNGRYVVAAFLILWVASTPIIARTLVSWREQAVRLAYEAQQEVCSDICPVDVFESAPLARVVGMVVLAQNMDRVTPPNEFPSRVNSDAGSLDPMLVSQLGSAAGLYLEIAGTPGNNLQFMYVTAGPVVGDEEEELNKEISLREFLVGFGIPREAIIIEDQGSNVRDAVLDVEDYLDDTGRLTPEGVPSRDANRIVLVAPALIMRRAALSFEEEDIEVVAWPTNLYGISEPTIDDDVLAALSDLVPSAEALRLTTRYWNELLTSFYYLLRRWLPGFDVRWDEIVEIIPRQ
ncbi:MAG: ElyC/SanA/YdcF family protein, partial [Cyanobacteria bacterium J06559_3]